MKIELTEEEIKVIAEILKYSLGSCPVESISDQVSVSVEGVQELKAHHSSPWK